MNFKNSYIWSLLRWLKQRIYSLKKNQDEILIFKKEKFLIKSKILTSQKLQFFLQGRMDIDPLGFWHNPNFCNEFGGFMPKPDQSPTCRQIVDVESHDSVRRDMICLLLRTILQNNINGAFAELGVYKGETAKLVHYYCPEREFYLFDTFNGFDSRDVVLENEQIKNSESINNFKDTTLNSVLRYIAPKNNNLRIIKGFFPDSILNKDIPSKFAFVHLDADLYAPTKAGLEFFFPLVPTDGFILIHDYNAWPGARKAVDEFLIDKTEIVIPMPDKSGSGLIVKS